jgi:hypothetical protein
MIGEDLWRVQTLARLLVEGRDPDYIAMSLERPRQWVEDMARSPEVAKFCADMRTGKFQRETTDAIWGTERTSLEVQWKTPEAIRRLWAVIEGEDIHPAVRLRALEMWFKLNDKMPKAQDAVDEVTPEPVFSDADWERLKKLEETREFRLRLIEGNKG